MSITGRIRFMKSRLWRETHSRPRSGQGNYLLGLAHHGSQAGRQTETGNDPSTVPKTRGYTVSPHFPRLPTCSWKLTEFANHAG